MHFAEHFCEFVIRKECFQHALKNDIYKASVEALFLEHVEDPHYTMTHCLTSYKVTQFI